MTSNQFDPRSMKEAQSVSNYNTPGGDPSGYVRESAWVVWVQFAAVMLMLTGSFHVIQGFTALLHHETFQVEDSGLALNAGYTTWGWVHLVWGAVAILVGVSLLAGRAWARILAVIVAFFSAVGNIAFLHASPVWGAIAIAVDVIVIWAIMVHGGELKRPKI